MSGVKQAVEETAGQVLTYEGVPVEPFFHKDSAGVTRAGEEPYLVSVDSKWDMEAEGYEAVREWKEETYGEIQMISRDEAGYVEEIQIGGQVYTGDEAMELLQLPSPGIYHFPPGRRAGGSSLSWGGTWDWAQPVWGRKTGGGRLRGRGDSWLLF